MRVHWELWLTGPFHWPVHILLGVALFPPDALKRCDIWRLGLCVVLSNVGGVRCESLKRSLMFFCCFFFSPVPKGRRSKLSRPMAAHVPPLLGQRGASHPAGGEQVFRGVPGQELHLRLIPRTQEVSCVGIRGPFFTSGADESIVLIFFVLFFFTKICVRVLRMRLGLID